MIKSWVLIILVIANALYSQEKEVVCDSIKWAKNYKLKWSDFKGALPFGKEKKKSTLAASSLEIVARAQDYDEIDRPIFNIETYFHKDKSWTVIGTDDVLKHEQGHFDLAEIYARKLRKKYLDYYNQKVIDIEKYSNAYNINNKELSERQNEYDLEVFVNKVNPVIWYKKIAEELEELKEFELKSSCSKM